MILIDAGTTVRALFTRRQTVMKKTGPSYVQYTVDVLSDPYCGKVSFYHTVSNIFVPDFGRLCRRAVLTFKVGEAKIGDRIVNVTNLSPHALLIPANRLN